MRELIIIRPYGHEHAGHETVDLETQVDLARELFETAIENGALVVQEFPNGKREAVREFDPLAEKLTIMPRFVGG